MQKKVRQPIEHLQNWLENKCARATVAAKHQDFIGAVSSDHPQFGEVSEVLSLLCNHSLAQFRWRLENVDCTDLGETEIRAGLAYGFWNIQLQWAFDLWRGVAHERWNCLRGAGDALVLMLFALSADCPSVAKWAASHFIATVDEGDYSPSDVGDKDLSSWCFLTTLASCVARGRWFPTERWPEYDAAGESELGQYAPLLAALDDPTRWPAELEKFCDIRLAHSCRYPEVDAPRKIRDNGSVLYFSEWVPYLYLPLELTGLRGAYRMLTGKTIDLNAVEHPVLVPEWINLPSLRAPVPQFPEAEGNPVLSELWDDELSALARNAGARWFGEHWKPAEIFEVAK